MGPPPPKNAICIRKYLFFTLDWSKAHMDKLIALDPCQKVPNKREKGVGVRLNNFYWCAYFDVCSIKSNWKWNWTNILNSVCPIKLSASPQKWQLDPSKIILPRREIFFGLTQFSMYMNFLNDNLKINYSIYSPFSLSSLFFWTTFNFAKFFRDSMFLNKI